MELIKDNNFLVRNLQGSEVDLTPTEYYQKLITSDQIFKDPQQAAVIDRLQVIYDQLVVPRQKPTLFKKFKRKKNYSVSGMYLWGEVGIGKTFLVDCFFYCLPFKNKMRIHFHKFMRMIHDELRTLQGESHPLEKIAKRLSKETAVICFDELIVNDIADAMLLAGLFEALYKENICLLFTSNTKPENLYLKGLQRESFLPVIDLIKNNSEVIQLTSEKDYRLRNYQEDNFYYTPLNLDAELKLDQQFARLSEQAPENFDPINVYDRDIAVRKAANGVVWFDFRDICGVPRSQNDYLAIAANYHTIVVSNIPAIQPEQNDLARAFINLVDVFYDANKKLIISAEKPIEELYLCGKMLFEFARTRSRLTEMQTIAWHKKCETLSK